MPAHEHQLIDGHCSVCGRSKAQIDGALKAAAKRAAARATPAPAPTTDPAPAPDAPAPTNPKGDNPVTEQDRPVRRRTTANRRTASRRPAPATQPRNYTGWLIGLLLGVIVILLLSRFVRFTYTPTTTPFSVGSCGLKSGMRLDYEKSVELGRCEYVSLQPAPVAAVPAPATPVAAPTSAIPTAAPTSAIPTAAPAQPIDTAYVKKVCGVDVQKVGTEAGAWVFRSPNDQLTDLIVPSGFIATIHKGNSEIVVAVGRGQTYKAKAATLRYQPLYPAGDAVWDAQKLFEKERAFAQSENPSYVVTLER